MLARGARTSPWKRASTRSSFIPWELRHLVGINSGVYAGRKLRKVGWVNKHGVVSIFSGVVLLSLHQTVISTRTCRLIPALSFGRPGMVWRLPSCWRNWLRPFQTLSMTRGSSPSTACSLPRALMQSIRTPRSRPCWTILTRPNPCGFSSLAQSCCICATNSTRKGSFPQGISSPGRVPKLADVANGQCPLHRWGLWTFLPLCSAEETCFSEIVAIFAALHWDHFFERTRAKSFPEKNPGNSPFYNRGLSMPSTDMLWRPKGWWMSWISIWETATSSTSAVTSVAAKSIELLLDGKLGYGGFELWYCDILYYFYVRL